MFQPFQVELRFAEGLQLDRGGRAQPRGCVPRHCPDGLARRSQLGVSSSPPDVHEQGGRPMWDEQAQGAPLVGPVGMQVGGGNRRRDGTETRRCFHRGQILDHSRVGRAVHAHAAVGAFQSCRPLHGVVAVLEVLEVWHELAVRGVTAPDVLDDHHEAVAHVPGRMQVMAVVDKILAIGRAVQEHGDRPFGSRRPVDVRTQYGPIPGGHLDVALQVDPRPVVHAPGVGLGEAGRAHRRRRPDRATAGERSVLRLPFIRCRTCRPTWP